jgi:hypothetical protein
MKSMNMKCIVTGLEKRFTTSLLNNKLKKFGSVEIFAKYYVCKQAMKLLRSGLSIEEIRRQLNVSDFSKPVDVEVLYKLKLLKKSKRTKNKSKEEIKQIREQTEKNEKEWYGLREKMKTCTETWIKEMTGGPGGCQVKYGGTCIYVFIP